MFNQRVSSLVYALTFAALAAGGQGCAPDDPDWEGGTFQDPVANDRVGRLPPGDLYRAYQYNCSSPSCGYQVSTLNESTWCPEYAMFSGACRMFDFDLSRTKLSAEEEALTLEAISDSGLDGGRGGVLLRGEIVVTESPYTQSGYRSDFVATEVWWGGTGALVADDAGEFARVTDIGMDCRRDPCFYLRDVVVNARIPHRLSGLDFGPSGANSSQVVEAMDAAATDSGVIVVGTLVKADSEGRRAGLERTVEEYFVRVGP